MSKETDKKQDAHIARLRELLPDKYGKHLVIKKETKNQKLIRLLKNALGVIEALYIQNSEAFSSLKAIEYEKIIIDLKEAGFEYDANASLLKMAASDVLKSTRKPMIKAGEGQKTNEDQKVG